MTVKLKASPAEVNIIVAIADRAVKLAADSGVTLDKLSTIMDVTACHLNGCPLRLPDMLNGPDFDLAHDVVGIVNHIDRKTGKLDGRFLPRYAS